ncbi:MAG: DUF551 domain-containing protein [Bacillota bacterium]|nr:DUF551 domain-containing protein [Bacillota bacterium]
MIDEKKLNRGDLCDICRSVDCANCFGDEDFERWIESQPKVENMYMSPITIMQSETKMRLEGEIMKAVARYGIDVDKDELIKALNYDRRQYEKGYKDGLNKSNEWIPVSEGLPEESGTYIVNAIENCIVHVTFAKWMKRMKKWNLTGSRSYWKVTAWMPLPERYEENK